MPDQSAMPCSWEPLARVEVATLAPARLALHWAVQIVAAAGATLAPRAEDWSHTSLTWMAAERALGSVELGSTKCRAALRIDGFVLLVLDGNGRPAAELSLDGRTLDEGLTWLSAEIAKARGAPPVLLKRPVHDLPDHPAARGDTLRAPDGVASGELASWFSDAASVLGTLSAAINGAPVRIWPHHFDVAFLVALEPSSSRGEEARSIGVGMSPGDASYDEPYWYVTPWPYPKAASRPALEGGGVWNDRGWVGAVLRASALAARDAPTAQADRVEAFLRSGVTACRRLLGT